MRLFYAPLLALSLMLGKICFALAANAPAIAATGGTELTAAERVFLVAQDAYAKNRGAELQAAENKLRGIDSGFPLLGYVTSWRMLAMLNKADEYAVAEKSQIASFLDANRGAPYADGLQREWLRALGRRDAADLFEARAPHLAVDDAEISCHAWRFRLQRADASAIDEARSFWKAARATPAPCYDLVATLMSDGAIGAAETWPRIRKLFDANLIADARRSAGLIKNLPAQFERKSAQVVLDAWRYLEREQPDAKSPASVELFLFAIGRAARGDADRAAAIERKWDNSLPADARAFAWSQIALSAAMQHRPTALDYYARVPQASADAALSETQAAWKVRAALRALDWRQVKETIESMPPAERREPAWRYWLARAYSESGKTAAALPLRESLARESHFYGMLAAEELAIEPAISWQGVAVQPAELENVRKLPGVVRAIELYRLGMKPEGLREWNLAMSELSDARLLAASQVALEAGLPDRSISAADRTVSVHDFNQRYPMPHRRLMDEFAQTRQLDEAWLYGLIRQESRFMADAHSNAGARGLMQLMPPTARWAAKQSGVRDYRPEKVNDVAVNLELGSFYLRHVLDDLGMPLLATAAYNAGPGRARRWRADLVLDGAIYAETIPFNETRDYVKKVMVNAWYYAQRLGVRGVKLQSLLGTVPARSGGSLVAQAAQAGVR